MPEAYLDHYAATPIEPEAREAMLPFLGDEFGNPSSLHSWGDRAREALSEAREKVARLIGADDEEIIFTSNGTEANNLAIKGLATAWKKKGDHIVVSSIEHFSVLNAARTLEKSGFEVTLVPVDDSGILDIEALKESVHGDTVLISVMTANGGDRHHRADSGDRLLRPGEGNSLPHRCRRRGRLRSHRREGMGGDRALPLLRPHLRAQGGGSALPP